MSEKDNYDVIRALHKLHRREKVRLPHCPLCTVEIPSVKATEDTATYIESWREVQKGLRETLAKMKGANDVG